MSNSLDNDGLSADQICRPESLASAIKDQLEQASSVELFHLTVILEKMVADPNRIIAVRRHLRMGQTVRFLDFSDAGWQPKMLAGTVVAMTQNQVTVREQGASRQFKLPYAAIEIDSVDRATSIDGAPATGAGMAVHADESQEPGPEDFKAGDLVSFEDQYMVTHIGKIKRVNQYTATIICDGSRWRVPFHFLRHVVDL